MSESDLVETIASVVRRTNRGASDVAVARAIVTGLSAAGYEIVRTRPAAAGAHAEPPAVTRRARRPSRRAG
jgi:hypothetical protein